MFYFDLRGISSCFSVFFFILYFCNSAFFLRLSVSKCRPISLPFQNKYSFSGSTSILVIVFLSIILRNIPVHNRHFHNYLISTISVARSILPAKLFLTGIMFCTPSSPCEGSITLILYILMTFCNTLSSPASFQSVFQQFFKYSCQCDKRPAIILQSTILMQKACFPH